MTYTKQIKLPLVLKVDSCEEKSSTEETRERKTNECRYEQKLLVLHNPNNEEHGADIEDEHECKIGSNPIFSLLEV